MKKLIISFLLLFSITYLTAQDSNKLIMDTQIVSIMDNYIQDAEDRGFYLTGYIINRIDEIVFVKGLSEGLLGIVSEDYRTIYISDHLRNSGFLLKLTIYHELGHALSRTEEHSCGSCNDIMSEYSPENILVYENSKFWNFKLDEYFDWLNKI